MMDKRKFFKNEFIGLGAIVAMTTILASCSKNEEESGDGGSFGKTDPCIPQLNCHCISLQIDPFISE